MLNPSLVGRTDAVNILIHGITAAIGAVGIAYSLFGMPRTILAYVFRVLLFIGSILLLFPGHLESGIGLILTIFSLLGDRFMLRKQTGTV
jgi:TRAP-type uncharacterized transport system fused permease subunit